MRAEVSVQALYGFSSCIRETPNGSDAHPRGAFTCQRQTGTAVAATNDTFGGSELQLP